MSSAALIGRDHPAGVLRAEIVRATDSHGGLVLVTGEAGIGKTTLVTAAAEQGRRRGALVLSGSCWDSDSAPGYWPWVQVLRGLRRSASAEDWATVQEAAGEGLAVLLGEATVAEAGEGFPLYDAVTMALVAASQRYPVMVVLDDLHWADSASLKLLEFAAQHTWFERLLLVGTYRDVEVAAPDHPLRPLMAPLVAKATTLTLTGLSRDEVGALMARTAGSTPDAELVAEVHRRTGGNPFFVEQTARLWQSDGTVTAIAPGVRDAVHRRLSLLPDSVARLLTAAAVLGREFHRELLAGTAGVPVTQGDRLLDQAVAARLVVVRGEGQFAFAHDLVRETLYDSLDDDEVHRRHAEVVWALDAAPALAERIFPADLARHAHLAGGELPPERAVDLLLAAARDAGSRLATEEAIGHHRRALDLVATDDRRTLVLLGLGLELNHSGETVEAWQHFNGAIETALRLGDPDLMARVAITLFRHEAPGDRAPIGDELLRAAHRALVPESAAARDLPADRLMRELIERTSTLARRGNDDKALAFSLSAQHDSIWGPGNAKQREALTEELEAVARRNGDHEQEQYAASLRWVALVEQGDPRYLEQLHAFVALTERFESPRMGLGAVVDRSINALLIGRFAESEELLDRVEAAGTHDHVAFGYMNHHLRWALWLRQGRFDELDRLLAKLAEAGHPHLGLLEAITAVERGDVEPARRHVDQRGAWPEPYPRSFLSMWLRLQAQTAAATRDPERCERARADLAPHSGEWAVSIYGCDIGGPVDLWLGLLDLAQERWSEAVDRLTAAYSSADRLRSRPWSIEARAHLGEALLGLGEAKEAAAVLARAEAEAIEIGMPQIVARIRGSAPQIALAGNVFRRDGAVWTLGYDGQTVHLPDAKGLADLHLLLSRPGADISAVQLLNPAGGEVVVAARQLGGDVVLDERAKAEYKRRLGQLDEQIDRAVARGEDGKAAAFDEERQALLDELRLAAGLAGRSRRLGDEAERARKAVTARIRDTLRKLDDRHPALAAHLRATVSTGATCCYQPESDPDWRL